jgi:tetratricopeptide (TPR) repeat protein
VSEFVTMLPMRAWIRRSSTILVFVAAVASAGCGEVRGRRLVKQGNELYRQGNYAEAVARFKEAEQYAPELPQLWLNKGYTCRQMLTPGAKTPENEAAVKCALEAFQRLQALQPADKRAPSLYVQTLFEADRFEALSSMYLARYQKDPRDQEAINTLVQVYSKWPEHTKDALEWYAKKADLLSNDAEAQYTPAVFIWQLLQQKGGGNDKTEFDPRVDPNARKKDKKPPPEFAPGDIVGEERIALADRSIQYLEKAVAIRPKYAEAMTYLNLVYRQKAVAYFKSPDDWQKCVDKALEWRDKSLAVMGKPIPKADGGAGSSEASAKKGE